MTNVRFQRIDCKVFRGAQHVGASVNKALWLIVDGWVIWTGLVGGRQLRFTFFNLEHLFQSRCFAVSNCTVGKQAGVTEKGASRFSNHFHPVLKCIIKVTDFGRYFCSVETDSYIGGEWVTDRIEAGGTYTLLSLQRATLTRPPFLLWLKLLTFVGPSNHNQKWLQPFPPTPPLLLWVCSIGGILLQS